MLGGVEFTVPDLASCKPVVPVVGRPVVSADWPTVVVGKNISGLRYP